MESFRVLRVPRIAIHKNLFASLLIHSVATIVFKAYVMLPYIDGGQDTVLENVTPITCFVSNIKLSHDMSSFRIPSIAASCS